jgi:hypothetical protein
LVGLVFLEIQKVGAGVEVAAPSELGEWVVMALLSLVDLAELAVELAELVELVELDSVCRTLEGRGQRDRAMEAEEEEEGAQLIAGGRAELGGRARTGTPRFLGSATYSLRFGNCRNCCLLGNFSLQEKLPSKIYCSIYFLLTIVCRELLMRIFTVG